MIDTTKAELFVLKAAINNGWKLQPDQKAYKRLITSLAKREEDGDFICPCKVYVKGIVDLAEARCPCKEATDDIRVEGNCHCGMFFK